MKLISARVAMGIFALLGLSACEEGFGTTSPPDAQSESQAETRIEIQEVERPDIFSANENGLWDGRPSLGGVWIAHPDVTAPESVLITNTANNRQIPGALFKRERNNPGPRIQVSSDAAAQLGMLAGQPVKLSVVVVRREEVVIEPAPLPASEETSDTEQSGAEEDGDAAVTEAAIAGAAVAEVAEKPKKPGFWERFKESLKNKPDPEEAETLETETAETASVPEVETAPLDPVAATAAAAISAAEEQQAAAAQPDPKPESGAEGALKNPFVQVGLFGVEANANAAAANLRQAGVVPTVKKITNSEGKTLWRVLIGPVATADDQAEILALVKKLGYRDAFLSPN